LVINECGYGKIFWHFAYFSLSSRVFIFGTAKSAKRGML